jgi:hypothetical protein
MQLFNDKLGPNKPLNIIVGYRDLKLEFAKADIEDKPNVKMSMTITL